jgi:hypothetical protein
MKESRACRIDLTNADTLWPVSKAEPTVGHERAGQKLDRLLG